MNWYISNRADPIAVEIADRHYNRQKIGSPQFVPPGRCFCLRGFDFDAVWVTSWPYAKYTKHQWAGAWVNSIFRRESGPLASELIREAIALTLWKWPNVPDLGIITFIDRDKVRSKKDYGYCYLKAGFERCGETKGGLLALQMTPDRMPEPFRWTA